MTIGIRDVIFSHRDGIEMAIGMGYATVEMGLDGMQMVIVRSSLGRAPEILLNVAKVNETITTTERNLPLPILSPPHPPLSDFHFLYSPIEGCWEGVDSIP